MTFLRLALVGLLLYQGAFKLTHWEAEAIKPLIENSPILSWMYDVWSARVVAAILGGTEIVAALLIAVRAWSPFYSLVGSLLAVAVFAVSVSFLFTTPGMWSPVPEFPLPVPDATGTAILKDIVLLGVAGLLAHEARKAMSLA